MIRRHPLLTAAFAAVLALLLFKPAASAYYQATNGEGCTSCHEMTATWDTWKHSTHRSVGCLECHENDEVANARRAAKHVSGAVPEEIRVKGMDVARLMERCRGCHRQEFAAWEAGPHAAKFSKVFLDKK